MAGSNLIIGGYSCTASPADWILFVGSLWTIWTSWWVPELVELATHRRGGIPFRQRLSITNAAVQWNCARILAPSFTAIMSMARARSPEEWAVLFYFGYEPEHAAEGTIPRITPWQWAKIILMDLLRSCCRYHSSPTTRASSTRTLHSR